MNIRLSGAERKKLAAKMLADIDDACVTHFAELPRDHLGASEIGEKCMRRLVYSFRWMHREQFNGCMLRLFNRGHSEEARFVQWLRLIGAQAFENDPNTGKQFRVEGHGFFGGSLDGVALLPTLFGNLPAFLTEFKTHGEKSFKMLKADGVKLSKPKHFDQMCVYGEAYKFDYAIYFAVNKNTDELWIEIVELDHAHAKKLLAKAEAVISAPHLPNKIAASEAYMDCKFCPMAGVCHRGEPIDVNCRSCRYSIPRQSTKDWHCRQWNATIPHDAIPKACERWEAFS
jgi:hypothetical protein